MSTAIEHSRAAWAEYPYEGVEYPQRMRGVREAFDLGRQQIILALQHPGNCESCGHASDCSVHNAPAMPLDPCDCAKALGE